MSFEDELRRSLKHHVDAPVPEILATRLLIRAAALVHTHMDTVLSRENINMRGYLALAVIAMHKGKAIRPSDLSVSLDATRTQVTRLLDALAQQDLVTRAPSQEDRRALNLTLTAAGQRKLARCMPKVHTVYRQVWANIRDFTPVTRGLGALHAKLVTEHAMADGHAAQEDAA